MFNEPDHHQELRDAVRKLCAQFPDEYFRAIDEQRGYPEAFVNALLEAGWLGAMIPEEYGGPGLGLAEASVIMEEINRSGGNSGAVHGQMYNMGTLLRHGSKAQKQKYLPAIAAGKLRIQSMGVTEPTTGTDTTKLKTSAVKKGDRYVVNGQKVWISRVQHSDLMILLARTTPLAEVKKKSEGMSVFIVDLREAIGKGLTVRPIRNMVNHETNELFFEDLEIPEENLIGTEGILQLFDQAHKSLACFGLIDRRRRHGFGIEIMFVSIDNAYGNTITRCAVGKAHDVDHAIDIRGLTPATPNRTFLINLVNDDHFFVADPLCQLFGRDIGLKLHQAHAARFALFFRYRIS